MAVRDHLPALGSGAGLGVAVDVLVNSGELIRTLLGFLATNIELVLPMVSRLLSLAKAVPWLPEDALQTLMLALVGVFVLIYLARLARRWRQTIHD